MKSRTLLVLLGVSLALSLGIFLLIEFRDRHSVLIERIDPNTYVTSDLPKLLYANSLKNPNLELFSIFGDKGSFECLNGKDPSKMSTKEQLLEFIQGPCLPTIAVPGLIASRLSVKIDCEVLQSSNPGIFEACGWKTCSSWKMWESKPKSEYDLWISGFLSPVSLIFPKSVQCWGNLIQLNYNESETDIAKKFISPAGVEVKIYKQEEPDDFACGFAAINDIFPFPMQPLYAKGFKGIYDTLTKMGYQPGLTLHATPYDWRKTTLANGITEVLNQTIRQIYQVTGKPIIILAHSLGNFGVLHLLNSLSAEEKSKYIANYVSITNPLAGSPKSVKSFIGGDKEYVYKKYGISFFAQRMMLKDNSAAFDLVPKDIYDHFSNSAWMQEWKIRSDLEGQNDVRTPQGKQVWEDVVSKGNLPYKWFPSPLVNCSTGFEQRRDECGLYMYNWSSKPLAIINQDTFTACEQDMKKLFDEYALTTNVSDHLFEDTKTNNIRLLINPEVPVTLIYGSHLQTEMTFNWGYDPRNDSREDQFAVPNATIYSQGDQTVPTSSSLLPGLKWSWEFDNKDQSGIQSAKPVKVVEICSIYNNKGNIYDNISPDAPYSVINNEYIGLQCDCFTNKNDHPVLGQSCDHADILNDSKFLDFITKIVNANYKIANPNVLVSNILSEDDLRNIAKDCPRVGESSTTFLQILASRPNITLLAI